MPSLYSNNAGLLGQYSPFLYGGQPPQTGSPYMPYPTGLPTGLQTQQRPPGVGSMPNSLYGQGGYGQGGSGPLRWNYNGGWGYGNAAGGQQGQYPKPFNEYGINPLGGRNYDDQQRYISELQQRIDLQRQAQNIPVTPGERRRSLNPQEVAATAAPRTPPPRYR